MQLVDDKSNAGRFVLVFFMAKFLAMLLLGRGYSSLCCPVGPF